MVSSEPSQVTIPRTGQQQRAYGKRIPACQAQPGDLVFFADSDGTMTAPGHVGIILRNGFMIDAPRSGENIQIQPCTNQPDLAGFTNGSAEGWHSVTWTSCASPGAQRT